ncbi:nucleolar and coiled-body phosphoprotein [Striga asiatica]|uniref:Nucleolar and coiled-body phosphoprotein n=1 Tax=Striga asiatica TaxID=4170 RepID=A0A5A7QKT2_STRAF|nr:nucleolar and coiled-body phosphoprotein [Striga asiatica]
MQYNNTYNTAHNSPTLHQLRSFYTHTNPCFMPENSDVSPSCSSLFAFKPRQVILLQQQQRRAPMAKAKPETPAELKPEDESVLMSSVARWLEDKGFSKVLKRFLSAAQIEDDTWKARALNLNEIFLKYQESCNNAREQATSQKKIEKQTDVTLEKNGDANCTDSEQAVNKKKKKKKGKEDAAFAETGRTSEGTVINEKIYESNESKLSKESSGGEALESIEDQSTKKQKDKKKRKNKSISEALDADEKQIDVFPEVFQSNNQGLSKSSAEEALDEKTTKDKKPKKKTVEATENGDNEPEKATKKRKRTDHVEKENQYGEEVAVEESKSKKSKGLEADKDVDCGANGHAKQTDENANGAVIGNRVDKSSQKKSAKKQWNGSAEAVNIEVDKFAGLLQPKAGNAFQRVKIDEVEFVDERLQDNSYWAKITTHSSRSCSFKLNNLSLMVKNFEKYLPGGLEDGAETGYGAKAQEVLGQVKGRGFRHEKTKKKRGSYRGGQIDLQSHSIKFNYSDEE